MTTKVKTEKKVSDYENLTDREHALKRAGMYMGQTARQALERMIFNPTTNRYESTTLQLSEGFETVFDEILINAVDQQKDPKMTELHVNLTQDSISVMNNGQGIPLDEQKEVKSTGEKLWVPTMLFGRFRSSENYHDNRQGAGLNGFGAKLANCYCHKFQVETQHPKSRKYFSQTWRNNMLNEDPPIRKGYTGSDVKGGYVRITMWPDFEKFDMTRIDPDTMKLLCSRVYDVAGFLRSGISVYLNGELVPIKSFAEYTDLIMGPDVERLTYTIKDAENKSLNRLELAIAHSTEGFRCHGLINGLRTPDGTHVKEIVGELGRSVIDSLSRSREYKNLKFQPAQFKDQVFLLVKMTVNNPEFNSQRKTEFVSKRSSWGFNLEFTNAFLKRLESSELGIVDAMIALKNFKENRALTNAVKPQRKGRITDIDKLHDAENAGKAGYKTLILTEGDSAKALAKAGISVLDDNSNFGIYPLRGKILNIRDVSPATLASNELICNLMRIIGLKFGEKYTSLNELRYQRILIWTDADPDGAHILGLLLNFFHVGWPSLFTACGKNEGMDFCFMFASPLVKATSKSAKLPREYFFSEADIRKWRQSISKTKFEQYRLQWLKGLGSSDQTDAKYYFGNIDKFAIPLRHTGTESDNLIDLIFNKKRSDERKRWIEQVYHPDSSIALGQQMECITWLDFFNKHFIHFSMFDNVRSLPSVMDGLKPSQRKVLWTLLNQNTFDVQRLMSLVGKVMEKASYHSGDASLAEVIISMAQRHVGTNNINLLKPDGMFGDRDAPRVGSESNHASARYIFSCLEPIARNIFVKQDDELLTYNTDDDGKSIEPRYFMPLLPMLLVNGSSGIGTGWSTDCPRYHPLQLVEEVRKRLVNWDQFVVEYEAKLYDASNASLAALDAEWPSTLMPWYDLFKGDIQRVGPFSWELKGKFTRTKDTIVVTELPPETYTDSWKAKIESQCVIGVEEKKAKTKGVAKKAAKGKGKGAGKKPAAKKAKPKAKVSSPAADDFDADVSAMEEKAEKKKMLKSEFVKEVVPQLRGNNELSIVLKCDAERLAKLTDAELEKYLHLTNRVSFNNAWTFDVDCKLKKFQSPEAMIDYFCYNRLGLFEKRRQLMIQQMQYDSVELKNKRRYLEMVMGYGGKKPYNVGGKTIEQVSSELEKMGFDKLTLRPKFRDAADESGEGASYWYLGKMAQWSTTEEKINKLRKECDEVLAKLEQLKKSSPTEIWLEELVLFENAYQEFLAAKEVALSSDPDEKPSKKRGSKNPNSAPKRVKKSQL